jgi:cobalamin synthase
MGQRRIQETLFMDRKLGLLAANALRVISNAVAMLWLVLMAIALLIKGADEARIILAAIAIPVLLLWLLGRYAYRLVDWMTKDYPKELPPYGQRKQSRR